MSWVCLPPGQAALHTSTGIVIIPLDDARLKPVLENTSAPDVAPPAQVPTLKFGIAEAIECARECGVEIGLNMDRVEWFKKKRELKLKCKQYERILTVLQKHRKQHIARRRLENLK